MGEIIPYKARKPGGGRKKLKPEYNAGKNLKEQMDAAVILYKDEMTLQAIADALSLNPIKVRKLLITAGVYEDRNCFSVCPRCKKVIEYDYQSYCGNCGQYLDWSKLDDAEEEFIGWDGVEDDD